VHGPGAAGNLWLLFFLSILNHAAFTGSRVAVSLFAINQHASPFEVGLLIALYGLLPVMLSVPAGRMLDRVGMRRPMCVTSAIVAAAIALPFLWPGTAALYLACPLIGVGFVIYMMAVQNTVGMSGRPEDRPGNFGLLAMSFSISGFIGPMLAGFAIDTLGYRSSFLILALLPVAPALIIGAGRLALPGPSAHAARGPRAGIAALLREPRLQRVLIASGILSVAWDVFSFAIPLYGSRIHLSASVIGAILGAFAIATFLIRFALPLISRRFKPWPLIVTSMAGTACCYVLFPWIASVPLLMALAFALGLALGLSQPMVMSLIYIAAPEGRAGEAVGLRTVLVMSSQTVMPLLFGALGATLGMTPVFLAMAGFLGVAVWRVRGGAPRP
jgi:MFS family permease